MVDVIFNGVLMAADSGSPEALALILAGCVHVLQVAIKVGALVLLLIYSPVAYHPSNKVAD